MPRSAQPAGKVHNLTVSRSAAQIAHAVAKPSGTLVWVSAYLELLSFGVFLAFAVWACTKLGGGVLGGIGRAAGTSYATLGVASLGVSSAIAYRAGHGLSVELGKTLVTVNQALFVGTWFLSVFFLLAAGALALAAGRRALGWSGVGIALITLVTTAVSLDNLGQLSVLLWFSWVASTSIALVRGDRAAARAVAVAQRV